MVDFFDDIDKLEKLVLDSEGKEPEVKKRKKSASQAYIEYLQLQKQNYENPDDKPVAQAYKAIADAVAANAEWRALPRFENLMLRKSLLGYASSTTPIKQKLITQLKNKFSKITKKGPEE